MQRCGRIMFLAVAIFGVAAGAQTATESELLRVIESLQARVAELEGKVDLMARDEDEGSSDVKSRDPSGSRPDHAGSKTSSAENEFRIFWKKGLRMETDDGEFKFSVGGRIHIDHAWFDQDSGLRYAWDWDNGRPERVNLQNGAEFRFARLHVKGLAYGAIEFQGEYDFADGKAKIKDTYLAYDGVPYIGKLTVGHFKEPFSFDELTSDNDVTFMERALPNALVPGRNMGIAVSNALFDDRFTYAVGAFRETDDTGKGLQDSGYAITARVTGLPWKNEDASKLIHLGASYSWRDTDDETRISSAPEAHLSNWDFIDTGDFYAERLELAGVEAAVLLGPFWAQAEMVEAEADTRFRGSPHFDGWYALAAYVLTGEHREYHAEDGRVGGLTPEHPLGFGPNHRGWGAWELALRVSELDLADGLLRGGEERNYTVGLNWYLNANTRVRFNYIHATVNHDLYDGDLNVFQTRFQYHF